MLFVQMSKTETTQKYFLYANFGAKFTNKLQKIEKHCIMFTFLVVRSRPLLFKYFDSFPELFEALTINAQATFDVMKCTAPITICCNK